MPPREPLKTCGSEADEICGKLVPQAREPEKTCGPRKPGKLVPTRPGKLGKLVSPGSIKQKLHSEITLLYKNAKCGGGVELLNFRVRGTPLHGSTP